MLSGTHPVFAECTGGCDCFDGIYFGVGAGGNFSKNEAEKKNNDGVKTAEASVTNSRLLGSFSFGSCKKINTAPVCFGGEIGVDLSVAKHDDAKINDSNIRFTNNGIVPRLMFFAGHIVPEDGLLVFLGVGIAHVKKSLNNDIETVSISKLPVTVTLGFQKALCSKWHFRIEGGFMTKTTMENKFYKIESKYDATARVILIKNIKL
jgi:hypothetical protein